MFLYFPQAGEKSRKGHDRIFGDELFLYKGSGKKLCKLCKKAADCTRHERKLMNHQLKETDCSEWEKI